MKKFLAIIMAICMLTSVLCVTAIPSSAAGYFSVILLGHSSDGLEWALSIEEKFEVAWNEAVYYSTHLEEAWNSSTRYETEAERPAVEGFDSIIVEIYENWNADSNGNFGSGIGFKDGAIYVPENAKLVVNLRGNTINLNGKTMHIDAGADVTFRNGTILGEIQAHKNAKVNLVNTYLSNNPINNGSARTASIFGEGSLATIFAILALVASAVSICLTVVYNKKKAVSTTASAAKTENEE